MSEESILLPELPEKPIGWKKHMVLHLNFGGGKGGGVYEIHDEQGRKVEGISYGYNPEAQGFILDGEPDGGWLTWPELRAAYARQRATPNAE